ncbi:TonB-dependent receptor [Sphingobacterium sp. NPDC055346]
MSFIKDTILVLLTIFSHNLVFAQQGSSIQIDVVDDQTKEKIDGASIHFAEYAGSTDKTGSYYLESIKSGQYTIEVKAIGYIPYQGSFTKNSFEELHLVLSLQQEVAQIEGVTIIGNSENKKIKQAAIRNIFIDTRAVSSQALSLSDLMNRSTGIRVRQNGGLGSRPEVSVNGFQGKAIKYFKDGIPLDYLGDGYNLSSLPIEMLDHVEIYKGVLPVSLGSDALGGAVNLVTNKNQGKHAKVYYELGSFNTHRLGLMASNLSKNEKWSYGGEFFYNYSANDYDALVDVVNPETKNKEPQRLPLFHNAYRHYLGELFVGMRNRSWADELKFSLTGFNLYKEQQHPALMTDAYGALHSTQATLAPSIRYKANFLDNKLRIDQFNSYNILQTQRIDTLRGTYDWFGNFKPGANLGESRLPSQSKIDEKQWVNRTNLSYLVSPNSKVELNYVFSSANRSGKDPFGVKLEGSDIDVLSLASTYQKHVFGLSYEQSLLQDRLTNQLMGKYYVYKANGYQNTWFSVDITEKDKRNTSGDYWGITEAIKYQFSENNFLRASAEYTYRLPEREELFGNNIFIVPNFELNPEQSLNFNLGLHTQLLKPLTVELNSFYRNTKGLILLVPIQAPNAQYQNQENVRGYGVDLDMKYQISEQYQLSGNATWQDLRLFGIQNAQDSWKNKARLRNTPYFFANLAASAKYHDLFQRENELQVYLNYNFMREFYLETIPKEVEPGGFLGLSGSADLSSNLIIPNQHLLNAGFTFQFQKNKMAIGAEARNLLNRDIYDYYRVQRPGRSFHLKLSYQI